MGDEAGTADLNRYQQIMERIFFSHYVPNSHEVEFARNEMAQMAKELGIDLPKNLGDVVYSFRYRTPLPLSILRTAPEGQEWVIRPAGRGRYRFQIAAQVNIMPNPHLHKIKVPDATPNLITMYALGDEQALLAKLRYNRLIDIFTGVVCYSLQNHLRTFVRDLGQVETDEIYVGIDRWGAHHVFPVQVKGKKDKIGIVQIEQDIALCKVKFPNLICRPLAAQQMENDAIALFEFMKADDVTEIAKELHYRLVARDNMTLTDVETYRSLSSQSTS